MNYKAFVCFIFKKWKHFKQTLVHSSQLFVVGIHSIVVMLNSGSNHHRHMIDLSLVTGEKVDHVFFDPESLVNSDDVDPSFAQENLYSPCEIVRSEEEDTIYFIKTRTGEVLSCFFPILRKRSCCTYFLN